MGCFVHIILLGVACFVSLQKHAVVFVHVYQNGWGGGYVRGVFCPYTEANKYKRHDESKTRTHSLSKLPDDGDPWAPNNLLTTEQKKKEKKKKKKKKTPVEPRWAMHRLQPTKLNNFMSGHHKPGIIRL